MSLIEIPINTEVFEKARLDLIERLKKINEFAKNEPLIKCVQINEELMEKMISNALKT